MGTSVSSSIPWVQPKINSFFIGSLSLTFASKGVVEEIKIGSPKNPLKTVFLDLFKTTFNHLRIAFKHSKSITSLTKTRAQNFKYKTRSH